MKLSARIVLLAVALVASAFPLLAQNSGPSATGSFAFASGGQPLNIDFNARTKPNGTTDGQIVLTGSASVPDQNVDGEDPGSDAIVTVAITVQIDCLKVTGNSAAMSGAVTDSNIPAYVGHRAILAVVDNGEGAKAAARDQFMWGLYGTQSLTWVATDAELEFDPGVGLTWLATDYEREDDVGIPSNADLTVDCDRFPLGSYSLEDLPLGSGNIQVRP